MAGLATRWVFVVVLAVSLVLMAVGCQAGADVVFYTIEGGGHGWPGAGSDAGVTTSEIDATGVIWDFFAAHPMP
jgi:poly(3-hydroxybutyrate) depolymerase